ncbi:MAG: transglutaminase-like domain-containing protein, partial [Lachnospiraceae bacterium]|nr:transglutaminase-like domain-containing protein [Lachnospiraceae bacterium]
MTLYNWRFVFMVNIIRKNRKQQEKIALSDGIFLSGDFCERQEKRWSDFFVRTFFLFAIVVGSLGGMLSAFGITYEKWFFFIAALLVSLYCASLYFSSWWENLGYILLFVLVLNAGMGLQTYVSSGFYGILNDISAAATSFFETSAQVSYAEQVENHSLAISVAMCYFALIGCSLTNGLISRKMHCLPAFIFSGFFLLVPIYLEREPSAGYVILYAAGIFAIYIFRLNQYQMQNTNAKPYRKSMYKAAKKHRFSGSFSGRAAAAALLCVLLLCSIICGIVELALPKNAYLAAHPKSAFKLHTMDTMENFYLLGVMGLINFYPTTGGLVNGRLGGVNSVRLDYETDLTLEFVPYTYDRIYLKNFVGAQYRPYKNNWSILDEALRADAWNEETASLLQMGYYAALPDHARGVMIIRNVAAPAGVYLPYYSTDTDKILRHGMALEYTFYPLLTEHIIKKPAPLENDIWLDIPEENQSVIADFCRETGLSGTAQEIISQLRGCFQQKFPYTLSPGVTPRRKDFVNYFLTEKQKGYCAHYASAAVLILRYMGIPARYVEGYAVDAMEIAEDGTLTDHDADQYYNRIGIDSANTVSEIMPPQQSVISYDVSDGNAHAWVEVYDENIGWYPVELTPYQTEADENRSSIWDMFLRLFQ